MSDIAPKSDDQIAKDKEAVKAMTGAKQAMEATLRRIELLENALSSVRKQSTDINKALGDCIHVSSYDHQLGKHVPRKTADLFGAIAATIDKVL